MKAKVETILKYVLVGALVAALLLSIYLNININNSLQASLKNNRNDLNDALFCFRVSVGEATHIDSEPNEDNIEALIEDFFDDMLYSWLSLRVMEHLNPELSGYEKPLYCVDRFICYTSVAGGSNVRSVLEHLLAQAKHSGNYSIPVTAFKELNQTSFNKIDELAFEVTESFYAPFNVTRLDNTINMVEELQSILSQWIDKYSAGYEINSSTGVVGQFQNMTIHEGDITLRNSATFLIEIWGGIVYVKTTKEKGERYMFLFSCNFLTNMFHCPLVSLHCSKNSGSTL